ncbi:hypothetical protein [Streptomyces sp. CA-111067]|uniref:hypothetical protein n=1 Tax=Streptomyces sp. CA-111067 TaxID=3240046 RepID=UPI003D994658
MSVFRDELAAPMVHPDVVARQIGVYGLSRTCLRCPITHIRDRVMAGVHRLAERAGVRPA